jgi:tRNA nucleotidyltransferase (CCA-adding enzyme)
LAALDAAARAGGSLEARFAALTRTLDPLAVEALTGRFKAPAACRDLALLAARHANVIIDAAELNPKELLDLLDGTDVTAAVAGEPEVEDVRRRLERVRQAAVAVDAGAIARAAANPGEIRHRLHKARLEAIQKVLEV